MKKLILVIFIIIIIVSTIFLKKQTKENNPFIKNKYYCSENYERYKEYYKKNKNLSIKEVILNVNMNLDYNFYTNTEIVKDPDRIDVLVNKYYSLIDEYEPYDLINLPTTYSKSGMMLREEAKEALDNLVKDLNKENLSIYVISSYRSYNYQKKLYDNYKEMDGYEKADKYSARPSYSEHQTGLCIDIGTKEYDYINFEKSKEFIWMKNNAYKYGFILRYPKNKDHITGYSYESWHYRYVGKKLATYIYKNNITLEQYYGLGKNCRLKKK